MDTQTKPSRVIGPEDVRRGDYITVTHMTYEFIEDLCAPVPGEGVKIVRATVMSEDAGHARKVLAVCRPFVLTEDASGQRVSLDLRRHSIARLSRRYGRRAFKRNKPRKK